MLKYIKDNFSQIESFVTNIDIDNVYMKKINDELGYVKDCETNMYMFNLDKIDESHRTLG